MEQNLNGNAPGGGRKVDTSKLQAQVDQVFDAIINDPSRQQDFHIEKPEDASPEEKYQALCEVYADMQKEGDLSQVSKILASVLDLTELAKDAGISFEYNYGDLAKVKELIEIAHGEFVRGALSQQDLKITVEMFARFVEFLAFSQDVPNEHIVAGLRLKIAHAIRTGDFSNFRF